RLLAKPVESNTKNGESARVVTRGKAREAVTIYRTVANPERPERSGAKSKDAGKFTLVEAQPQTGRTHQIRVHLAFLGFPVVADAIYGRRKNALGLTRQFLHAWKIAFTLPRDGRAVNFVAPLPKDLRAALHVVAFDPDTLR
ncbi:MAG: hypothetical protein KGJ80_20965, partial [Chloroflexota bacterium]|nr:hypothetical protein [Chloroflexota bacterium]